MKALAQFLKQKTLQKKRDLDEKTVIFIFQKIIRKEYGERGLKNIQVQCYKEKTLYIQAIGSVWANEFWVNKKEIITLFNQEIGSKELYDLKVKR